MDLAKSLIIVELMGPTYLLGATSSFSSLSIPGMDQYPTFSIRLNVKSLLIVGWTLLLNNFTPVKFGLCPLFNKSLNTLEHYQHHPPPQALRLLSFRLLFRLSASILALLLTGFPFSSFLVAITLTIITIKCSSTFYQS